MGWFDWFRRRRRTETPAVAPAAAPVLEPESQWRTGIEGDTLWVMDPQGRRRTVAIAQLTGIAIETNDGGPIGIDFWWLFYGPDEDVAFALPLGAAGEGPVVDRIAALPGFRHDAYAAAIRSTDIDTFAIWQPAFD